MPFAAADVEIVGAVAIFSPSQPFRLPRGGAAGALVCVRSEADATEQDGDHVVPIIPNALGLTYRIVLGGRLWSYAEVASSLAAAGFADARRIRTSTSDLVEAAVRRGA